MTGTRMTDLTTLLARALQDADMDGSMWRGDHMLFLDEIAAAILATPEGQRIANVIEAAVAQHGRHDDPEFGCICDVCVAIDALEDPE